jgi:prepilin-type N-terminal cleavage/methylation domain-containing protein
MQPRNKNGFTLIELLVVISIIGILSSILLVTLQSARERARVAVAVLEINQLEKLVHVYFQDTGRFPPTCDRECTAATDPFINSLNIPGWRGPYMPVWSLAHPWKGHINFYNEARGPIISLDDDEPSGSQFSNGGPVPFASILRIDQIFDDGNPNTGRVRTNLNPECSVAGEVCYFVSK